MPIRFSKAFSKQYEKADKRIKSAFEKRLKLFKNNLQNPLLNNHPLTGKYKDCRSINITGDWRAIYIESREDREFVIIFIALGTHSQLYK